MDFCAEELKKSYAEKEQNVLVPFSTEMLRRDAGDTEM